MTKIKFTSEHMRQLIDLAADALFNNTEVQSKLGQTLNIHNLLHTVSINQLVEIRNIYSKKIEKLEGDEWIVPNELDEYKKVKELVNLIIGYRRYKIECAEIEAKRKALLDEIEELRESKKTPDEKIKDLEDQLKELSEF